jgi:azurin
MKLKIFALLLLCLAAAPTWAATCSTTITGNDALRYDKSTLKNVGSMPRSVMGHNVVIAAAADEQAVINDGAIAGIDHDYVKPNDANVIANTTVIGGDDTASTTFKVSALKAGTAYEFFCTCPGHASLMRGKIELI